VLVAVAQAAGERDRRIRERVFYEADGAFHLALIEATGNLALAQLVRRVNAALVAARYPLARPADWRTRAISEHEAIVMAIRDRDPAAARAAMAAHLDSVEHRLREHAERVARAA
jgi:GntR family transcriptional repressor for pyruvate dehydrogenase complex